MATDSRRYPGVHRGERDGAETDDGNMAILMGIFTLDFAFGTAPNPGGGSAGTSRSDPTTGGTAI